MYSRGLFPVKQLSSDEKFATGLFLWVWKPDSVPPHIGISQNGVYYSLLINGKESAVSTVEILQKIERKKIEMLWLEIKNTHLDLELTYARFTSCKEQKCSCLQPILETFQLKSDQAVLVDLLQELNTQERIGQSIGLNLSPTFEGIRIYSKLDVNSHLKELG